MDNTFSGGQFIYSGSRGKVHKATFYWIGRNPHLGVRFFSTWREAMDFANLRVYTMNEPWHGKAVTHG